MFTRLRTLAFTLFFFLCSLNLHSQWVAIPDSNFGTWLDTSGYSQCLQGSNAIGWQMDTTCNAVVNANSVNFNGLVWIGNLNGIQYFDNLDSLICNSIHLNSLPAIPNSLTTLVCANNYLNTLPALPGFLSTLNCTGNYLDTLPALPSSLEVLICLGSHLKSLPQLPDLRFLWCVGNDLDSLPELPATLDTLWCGGNNLHHLPTLPNTMKNLSCSGNSIDSLPLLPTNLWNLDCSSNQATYLPELPKSITHLSCGFNNYVSLPDLPDSLVYFSCSGSQYLTCLPQLKIVRDFRFYSCGFTCLPNYPQLTTYSNPILTSVPVCSFFNNYGCASYSNIEGKIYYDSIPDCLYDFEESTISNLKVRLYQGGILKQEVFSSIREGFVFDVSGYGTYSYSIDSSSIPFVVSCPAQGFRTSTITVLDSMDFNMDFGLRCKPGFDLIAQSIEAIFRPGTVSQVNVLAGDASAFYNAHCAAGTSGAVTVTINGSAHYTAPAAGALTPSVNGNTLTYTIADFGAVDFFHAFNILVQTDTTAVLGSQICITVSITPTAGDNNPTNNSLTICFPVVASYDPNDKTAYPAGDIGTAQKEITYTVRFQNTGTAEAQHIYITDTLDTDIDEGSFQLLAYSHQPMVQIEQNRVRFNFPNINLPDSNTNEPLSHGYVQYKVKLKDNLPIGTTIHNTAHIYFDFNAPVVTNTTSNTITTNTAVAEVRSQILDFRLSPNPTREAFAVSVSENLIGKQLIVTDATGRVVFQSKISNLKSEINVNSLSDGLYLVKVGNAVKRLIIQR